MKATKIQSVIAPGPLDDFQDWLMSGRAFNKPVPVEHYDAAVELLTFAKRGYRARLLPGNHHYWFEVEAAFGALAGGTARVRP